MSPLRPEDDRAARGRRRRVVGVTRVLARDAPRSDTRRHEARRDRARPADLNGLDRHGARARRVGRREQANSQRARRRLAEDACSGGDGSTDGDARGRHVRPQAGGRRRHLERERVAGARPRGVERIARVAQHEPPGADRVQRADGLSEGRCGDLPADGGAPSTGRIARREHPERERLARLEGARPDRTRVANPPTASGRGARELEEDRAFAPSPSSGSRRSRSATARSARPPSTRP